MLLVYKNQLEENEGLTKTNYKSTYVKAYTVCLGTTLMIWLFFSIVFIANIINKDQCQHH